MKTIVDEKFKDASPMDTVEKIKKILNDCGLSVTEDWGESCVSNCYALNLKMDGTSFYSNGKGVTEDLARASAYAEMMERLQSGTLGNSARANFRDSKQMDRQTLKENADILFDRLSEIIKEFDGIDVSPDRILEAVFEYGGCTETTGTIPFYSIFDDKMVQFPATLRVPLYSTTGLAAGNTPEEAMVQGMSEIMERWCQRYFLCKDLVPPTIPDEYLKQFPMAYETICQVRNSGYDVTIKDCSMGMGWPVIATVVIDKKTHAYHVHMGASPVFEIALGRSLTETFQGRKLKSVADTYLTESAKNVLTYRKSYVKGRGAYPISFFADKSSFDFIPFEDRSHCSNQELLQYAVNFFREKGMKIYVRDMSHFGFPTYQIIIPEICVSHFSAFTYEFNVPKLTGNMRKIWADLKSATEDKLFELQIYNTYLMNNIFLDGSPRCLNLMQVPISNNSLEDCAVACMHLAYTEWQCGNWGMALKYARSVEGIGVAGISDYCSCLCRAKSMLKEGQDLEVVMKRLSLFYEEQTIMEVQLILEKKENPFAPYVVSCGRDNEKCGQCRYVNSCLRNNNRKVGEIVDKYVSVFDNDKAFADLKKIFENLV